MNFVFSKTQSGIVSENPFMDRVNLCEGVSTLSDMSRQLLRMREMRMIGRKIRYLRQ